MYKFRKCIPHCVEYIPTSGKGRRILFYVRGYRFVLDLVLGKPGFAVNEGLWFVSLLTLFFAPYTKKLNSGTDNATTNSLLYVITHIKIMQSN